MNYEINTKGRSWLNGELQNSKPDSSPSTPRNQRSSALSLSTAMALPCAAARITAAAAASPASPEPRQTKVILPKEKPLKWSTGMAPGEYGGPPVTVELRKYWGGKNVDPVTDMGDDFIWNKDFVGSMKRLYGGEPPKPAAVLAAPKEQDTGFLSLNRAMSLDSMDIDLCEELAAPPKSVLEQQVEAARRGRSTVQSPVGSATPRWRLVPTRREQAKWDRESKAAIGGNDVILRESSRPKVQGDPKVLAAQARIQYLKLKEKMQIFTLGIGGVGLVSAYISYSPEIAASFGVGLLGSLAYIRMLGNSVDFMANGGRGFVKAAVGQPRLFVPVALVMLYNRWNGILVPEYGFMHLELIPMLVGFFTYKIATFAQTIEEALDVE